MRVLMLVSNTCVHDARVIKEAETVAKWGNDVVVLATHAEDCPAREYRNGVTYIRCGGSRPPRQELEQLRSHRPTPPLLEEIDDLGGQSSAVPQLRAAVSRMKHSSRAVAAWTSQAATRLARSMIFGLGLKSGVISILNLKKFYSVGIDLKPEIVHAHDLSTLLAGARIARKADAKLIYDAHELEIGRNTRDGRLAKWLHARIEKALISKTDAVITVSDSIADFMQSVYEIERPVVVLNSPRSDTVAAQADHVRLRLGLREETPLAIYVGSATFNRGLEVSVKALNYAPNLHLALIGPRQAGTEAALLQEADTSGVRDRLHFIDPVPHDQVSSFIRSADVSLILIQDTCLSYKLCFPNKLLESLFAGLPILVTRLVELEKLVQRTGAGIVLDRAEPQQIAKGILTIAAGRDKFRPKAQQIEWIKSEYGWQIQEQRLKQLYSRLSK